MTSGIAGWEQAGDEAGHSSYEKRSCQGDPPAQVGHAKVGEGVARYLCQGEQGKVNKDVPGKTAAFIESP